MAKSSAKTTKYYIPHPADPTCKIAGILEQLEPELSTRGRKIALILHGVMGHKDYLFQKSLAKLLPMDSFRFDFRGNHETPGIVRVGGLADDVEDIKAVVAFLSVELGYSVDVVIGHSRGSLVSFRWICTTPEGAGISAFVNVSGRYRMEKMRERLSVYKDEMDRQGFYEWKAKVAGKEQVSKIYPEDVEGFAVWDTSLVWDRFPPRINVLTIHGLADATVPVYDAIIYARALSPRPAGTHTLHLVEAADHNFAGKYEEVNDTILEWLTQLRQGTLTTGLWKTGVRGKL